jgi:hypothetical protein
MKEVLEITAAILGSIGLAVLFWMLLVITP